MSVTYTKDFIAKAISELCATMIGSEITMKTESGFIKFYQESKFLFKIWINDVRGCSTVSITRIHISAVELMNLVKRFEDVFGESTKFTLNELL